ncbi:MAG: TIGR02266 family protein [Anaeromyxobacteraceae bacterium]
MSAEKRGDPRVPVELRLRLAYGSVADFVERWAVNISRGGVFIRTLEPCAPGTEVLLEITLASGEPVIHGRGVVRWTTAPSAPGEPAQEPGMGVKFLALSPGSQALVDAVVGRGGDAAASDEPPPAPRAEAPPAPQAAPRPRRPKGPVVGIDLGTTNSCVAAMVNGKPQVLASREGHRTLPSVVAYDAEGRLLVGHPAKAQMIVNPRNTVYGSKRLVGRPYASPTVQACKDRFHYEIVPGPGGAAAVRFAGRDFSLAQVAALVLQEMREVASQALGQLVERAVVTVPAHYNDHQRQAVREAGQLAGLHVERLVNEPTAAALAFGAGRGLDRRVLVYDLGGGTFDASVLEISGDVYEVVSSGGDTFLGGVDFDAQLVDHLVWRFMQAYGAPPPDDRVVWQRLRDAAEETKVALSAREKALARVPFLMTSPAGKAIDLSVEVTRSELEGLTAKLVQRTLDVCREVLTAKGLGPGDVQEVLLVGGQSRMPLVWRRIKEELGRDPSKGVHPDEAVAIGAALLGDSESRIDSVVLIDALAIGIGVGLPGGRMVPVLPRNTRLPASKVHELHTTHDGQTELELHVFQGDAPRVEDCEYLGTARVAGLPAAQKGAVRVAVEFALGQEGILSVHAREHGTGRATEVRFATLDTPESLRAKLGLERAPGAPPGARPLDPTARKDHVKPGILGRMFGSRK